MKSRASLFFFLLVTTFSAAQTYTVTDLGTLPGGNSSGAKAVNATAQVTGFAFQSSTISDVFRYSNGSMTNLGTLGGNSAIGNGINASGQIAGYSTNATPTYRAFVTKGDTLTDIGDLGGGSARLSHQLFFRPVFPYFRYRTPVRGLYLCSASTHPGAGVHGACGFNAARMALRDNR